MYLKSEITRVTTDIVLKLETHEFLCGLAFLTDMTSHLNDLNTKLQGRGKNITHLFGHMNGFRRKLELFATHFENEDLLHCKEIKNEFSNLQFSPFRQNILDILKEFNGRFTDFQNLKMMFYYIQIH